MRYFASLLEDLPRLLGGTEFTKNTLRFAWHLTTVGGAVRRRGRCLAWAANH